jgi:calcineurin-like phosphoesterase family protein
MWSTPGLTKAVVEYSPDGISFQRVPAESRIFGNEESRGDGFVQYTARLEGLAPHTRYLYRVVLGDGTVLAQDGMDFLSHGRGPFNFLVLGDSGEPSSEQYLLAQQLSQERPAVVIHTGDIAYYEGSFREFRINYFDRYPLMRGVPFFPAPGNHDYLTPDAAPYRALHSLPLGKVPESDRGKYYSFDWSNAHFVSLDSNASLDRAATGESGMLKWLEEDLRNTSKFWRIVFFHHSPYGTGPTQTNLQSALVRDLLVPILERHGVQVVFSGHEHSYQRTVPVRNGVPSADGNGETYFTTGGGGGGLYPVYPSALMAAAASEYHYLRVHVGGGRLKVNAIALNGFELDSYFLEPKPAFLRDNYGAVISLKPSGFGAEISIHGTSLALDEVSAPQGGTSFENMTTEVFVNGTQVPLYSASPKLIHGYVPFPIDGSASVRVVTTNGSAEASIPLNRLNTAYPFDPRF